MLIVPAPEVHNENHVGVEDPSHEAAGAQDDAHDAMMNFNERDLVFAAELAGFDTVHADLSVSVRPGTWTADWERLLDRLPVCEAWFEAERCADDLKS